MSTIKKSLLIDQEADTIIKFVVAENEKRGFKLTQGEAISHFIKLAFSMEKMDFMAGDSIQNILMDLICHKHLSFEYEKLILATLKGDPPDVPPLDINRYYQMGEELYDILQNKEDIFLGQVEPYHQEILSLFRKEIFMEIWKFSICLINNDFESYPALKDHLIDAIIMRNPLKDMLKDYLLNLETELPSSPLDTVTFEQYYMDFTENLAQEEGENYIHEAYIECLAFIKQNTQEIFQKAWNLALEEIHIEKEFEKGKSPEELAQQAFKILFARNC